MSADENTSKPATINTQNALMLQRVSTFRDLERAFRLEREKFAQLEKPCALFTATKGRERWGIWRLLPSDPEMEPSWAEFDLLAAAAIDAVGLPPLLHPTAKEFDVKWRRKRTIPQGLDAVHESTRAWLDLLRTEWVRRKGEEFECDTLRDVWGASASQCKALARDCKIASYQELKDPAINEQVRKLRISDAVPISVNVNSLVPPEKDADQERLSKIRCDFVEPLLKAKRWTKSKWATKAGVGKNSVYEYLYGKRKLSTENRKAMRDALGITADQLPE